MDMIDKIVLSVAYEGIQRPYYLILTGLLETLRQLCPNMLNVALLIERPNRLIKAPPLIPGNKSSRVPVSPYRLDNLHPLAFVGTML
jgi:hypothetical protein